MFTKLAEIVAEGLAFRALYAYDITHENTIPVVIIEEYSEEVVEKLSALSQPGWIILTTNDLLHGHDVYSIILHHIHCRSELVVGDDLIAKISLSTQDMRPHLEGHIRHILIDLREAIVQKKYLADLLPWLTIQADRMRCACGFMIRNKSIHGGSMADTIDLIDSTRGIDHGDLYRTLHHGTGAIDLVKIHDLLEALVAYVDTIDKKNTNK